MINNSSSTIQFDVFFHDVELIWLTQNVACGIKR